MHHWNSRSVRYEKFEFKLDSLSEINDLIAEFEEWDGYRDVVKYANSRASTKPVVVPPKQSDQQVRKRGKKLPLAGFDEVRIGHNGNSLSLRPNGLVAQLKIANILARYNPHKWDRYLKRYVSELSKIKSLDKIWSSGRSLKDHPLIQGLPSRNVYLKFDVQALRYVEKKRRWFKRRTVAFEQWIQETEESDWREIYAEEGVRTVLEDLYMGQLRKLFYLSEKYRFIEKLYEFQVDDVARASLKDSVLDGSEMGTGKTLHVTLKCYDFG